MNYNNGCDIHSCKSSNVIIKPYSAVIKKNPQILTRTGEIPHIGFYSPIITMKTKCGDIIHINPCERHHFDCDEPKPDICFQTGCSTLFPCHSSMNTTYNHKNIKKDKHNCPYSTNYYY